MKQVPMARIATIAAIGAAGLLAGCGSGAPSASPTVTVTTTTTITAQPSATATPVVTPAGPPGCATSGLAVSLGPGSAAAGSAYYPIEFTNTSSSTCSLYG
jgi:hypothetical protein